MAFSRSLATIVTGPGLVACGAAGVVAWNCGYWGLLTGSVLVALWLCLLNAWALVQPLPAVQPPTDTDASDAPAMVLRLLLDAAPTPLIGIDQTGARALNRAARQRFATDDRILPMPAGLGDPAVTHLRHDGRSWRIDRVTVTGSLSGRSVAALIDIEQEEHAAEARATAELIQILGHELLNGLAPIVSLAESGAAAVDRPGVDPALLREILGTLARRAEGLQRFTEAYRALARLPQPTREPSALDEMAGDLARLFAGRWPAIALSVETLEGIWTLDRDQISQALWALLQNAAEAPGTTRVTLRFQPAEAGLAIDVEDDGTGVAPDAATRIFRPFHTTKPDGTGIGLSLARQIALAHGGTLTLEPASATVFRLLLLQ